MTTDILPSPNSVQVPLAESRRDVPEQRLEHTRAEISSDVELYGTEQIGLPEYLGDGGRLSVFGEVSLKGIDNNRVDLALIKCTEPRGGETVYVAGMLPDKKGNMTAMSFDHWQRLDDDSTFSLGRATPTSSSMDNGRRLFGNIFTDDISRNHLGITSNRGILTIVDSSSHGSSYRGVNTETMPPIDRYDYDASHTISAEEGARLRKQLQLDKEKGIELFQGRQTIGRDTFPIDGHVDIRSWIAGDEAIVVDSKKYPKEFEDLRAAFDRNLQDITITGVRRDPSEADVLKAISNTVDQAMVYDLAFVNKLAEEVKAEVPEHRKAALNMYLNEGKGVCRHMALAVSWLGGDAVSRGLIKGRFTTEVNQNRKSNGAHEWCRFVGDADPTDVYIIDVAQHFVGKLVDTDSKSAGGEERWGYFRDQAERDLYRKLKVGSKILTTANVITIPNRMITSDDVPKN